jgi:uncharacterized protein
MSSSSSPDPSSSSSSAPPRRNNRLAQETSPYLLQHQHNPVDWYPWGPEAFERARREDRPIFLSVGYSTCYWCHVMERQSFENDAVAAVMNAKFVNIKVDREERPDVDQLYMTAVQVLTRHGGWPMSVWLTPDLKPFYGGTYYPPTDQHGRPGFVTLLTALEEAYRERRADVEKTAEQITGILRRFAEPAPPERPIRIDAAFADELVERSTSDYDPRHGGFGGAPKFPRETLLELLLVYLGTSLHTPTDVREQTEARKAPVRQKVLHTLDALAAGGIRDHLGGGFHRYSTDAHWLVPHFEIMLYDNALLAWCYAEAFRQTQEPRYAAVARGVFDFVLREMTSPEGAFYTALDAEVDGQEGLNYLWTPQEIESILGPEEAKVFNRVYGVDRGPNFADPHPGSGVPDMNILFLPEPINDPQLGAQLEPMRQKLKAVRDHRKQPLLDTKVLTSWNALMIRALAHGGRVLREERYVHAAARAAQFILMHHRTSDGGLYRASRDGKTKYEGFLDDYAFLAQAMLALSESTTSGKWKDDAATVIKAMTHRFGDDDGGTGGFYFTDARATDLVVRQKTATDSPLPSGNAMAAMALLALGDAGAARATIAAFAQQIEHNGEGMSSMVQAALLYLRKGGEPFIVLSAADATVPITPSTSSAAPDVTPARPASPQKVAEQLVRLGGDWVSRTELHVRLHVNPGFHVNAHEPGGGGGGDLPLVPTRLVVDGVPDPAGVSVTYPPGDELSFPFAPTPVRVYGGDVTIVVRFARPVTSELRLSLTYQACDDAACLPPVTKRLDVPPP